jgi:hypothetical protein
MMVEFDYCEQSGRYLPQHGDGLKRKISTKITKHGREGGRADWMKTAVRYHYRSGRIDQDDKAFQYADPGEERR